MDYIRDNAAIEDYIREEAARQGLEQGLEQGLKQGLEQGLEQGLKQGLQEGEERFARLTCLLTDANRSVDLSRAIADKSYRDLLYQEYGL